MNNKNIGVLVLLLIFSLGFFTEAKISQVETDGRTDYEIEVNINKGWNLVLAAPIIGDEDNFISVDSDIKKEDIKVIFYYLRKENNYLQIYPRFDNKLNRIDILTDDERSYLSQSPVWIYSERSGVLNYMKDEVPRSKDYNNILFNKGWNFVGITSPMAEKTLNDIKGSCDIDKVYFFSDRENPSGGWMVFPMDVRFLERDSTGGGILVKVSSDCRFGFSGDNQQVSPPPQIPTDIIQCTESDSGRDYSKKGTTKGMTTLFVSEVNGTRTPVYAEYTNICHKDNQAVTIEGLFEYYCEDNQIKVTGGEDLYVCPNKWEDGRCL